ncbi:MAG: hypothetical protein EBY92_04715 [Actinobacteria bacterium]|nr:hypothetical protein [Actinomycetota bacterium]
MMRENEKITTPRPSVAITGNSIGCSSRRRANSLWAGSSDAVSLHACTIHSASAATSTIPPKMKYSCDTTRPSTSNTRPTAAISGHIDARVSAVSRGCVSSSPSLIISTAAETPMSAANNMLSATPPMARRSTKIR